MSLSDLNKNSLTQNLPFSGSYIPTVSASAGTTVSSPVIRYIRIGNIVQCSLYAFITTTAATNFTFDFSIPIDRYNNFSNDFDCGGSVSWDNLLNPTSGSISVVAGTKTLRINVLNTAIVSDRVGASFTYEV